MGAPGPCAMSGVTIYILNFPISGPALRGRLIHDVYRLSSPLRIHRDAQLRSRLPCRYDLASLFVPHSHGNNRAKAIKAPTSLLLRVLSQHRSTDPLTPWQWFIRHNDLAQHLSPAGGRSAPRFQCPNPIVSLPAASAPHSRLELYCQLGTRRLLQVHSDLALIAAAPSEPPWNIAGGGHLRCNLHWNVYCILTMCWRSSVSLLLGPGLG